LGILLETDAPWLAPQSKRGQRHTPGYIPEQYAFLAELANQSVVDFSERVISDRKRFYHV
jgi:Tat protein secretion system quality control protein TatD with DNase activity